MVSSCLMLFDIFPYVAIGDISDYLKITPVSQCKCLNFVFTKLIIYQINHII